MYDFGANVLVLTEVGDKTKVEINIVIVLFDR